MIFSSLNLYLLMIIYSWKVLNNSEHRLIFSLSELDNLLLITFKCIKVFANNSIHQKSVILSLSICLTIYYNRYISDCGYEIIFTVRSQHITVCYSSKPMHFHIDILWLWSGDQMHVKIHRYNDKVGVRSQHEWTNKTFIQESATSNSTDVHPLVSNINWITSTLFMLLWLGSCFC